MSLEFEKLVDSLDRMARGAAKRRQQHKEIISDVMHTLEQFAEDWEAIESALERARELSDPKHYRSARPLNHQEPLNAQINPPIPPAQATIIATDGSQIMPDRHAAHLYYLINIGGIIYFHGSGGAHGTGRSPSPFSLPQLIYPRNNQEAAEFAISSGAVSIARDLKEIGTLADKAWENRFHDNFLMAILDQRLLYWPIGGSDAAPNKDVKQWLASMSKLRESGANLAGYIDRPMTNAVVTLLMSLTGLENPYFDWKSLGKWGTGGGLTDAALFSQILEPGQRSKVYAGVSPPNSQFVDYDPANEVCFFYMNPGLSGRSIARIDIPMWVAQDETAVSTVHSLIYDQCCILDGYPYVIARADEMAVVGYEDHEELNFMIDLYMQRYGVENRLTAKQSSKGLARGGKTRHEV